MTADLDGKSGTVTGDVDRENPSVLNYYKPTLKILKIAIGLADMIPRALANTQLQQPHAHNAGVTRG